MPRRLVGSAILAAAVVLVYWSAPGGEFIWDDDAHLASNTTLRTLPGLRWIWLRPGLVPAAEGFVPTHYYPLMYTSFWFEYRLWGLDPHGYHVTNVLLHAAASLLVWAVLRRLQVPGAFLAAAIFALHPVHVESVAWISERKNVLSACFYLSAALAYLRFSPPDGQPLSGRHRDYRLALVLFLGALLSKTVTLTLPIALGVVLWWKRGRLTRREVLALLNLAAVGVAVALVTIAVEWRLAGAGGPEFRFTLIERCLIAGRALCFYLGKLFWPAGQAFFYPSWTIDARAAWQYLFPVGAIGALLAAWRLRHVVGRGPLCAGLFFVVTLLPALGFVNFYTMGYTFVADHFQYLASLGPIAMASAGMAALARRWPWRPAAPVLATVLLAALGVLSYRRVSVFRSDEALWQDTLAKNPRSWMALNNLAADRLARNRLGEARLLLEQALQVRPDYPKARMNLGLLLQREGRIAEAIEQFEAAASDERHGSARFRIGLLRAEQGRFAEAISDFRQALAVDPGRATMLDALAHALASNGQMDEAVRTYRRALAVDPERLATRYNLAVLLAGQGEAEEARDQFTRARERAVVLKRSEVVNSIDGHLRELRSDAGPDADPTSRTSERMRLAEPPDQPVPPSV